MDKSILCTEGKSIFSINKRFLFDYFYSKINQINQINQSLVN